MIKAIVPPLYSESLEHDSDRARIALNRDVVLVSVADGSSRLIDFDGKSYALSASGTELLLEMLRAGRDRAISKVASDYHIDPAQVAGDLADLLDNLNRERLLRRKGSGDLRYRAGEMAASCFIWPIVFLSRAVHRPARLQVWLLLSIASLSTRLFGWGKVVTAWKRALPLISNHGESRPEKERIDQVEKLVSEVAARHMLGTACKERGLCCWGLLRLKGIPAVLVVGLDLYPLASHCWCEHNSRTISDDQDKCDRYTPICQYS